VIISKYKIYILIALIFSFFIASCASKNLAKKYNIMLYSAYDFSGKSWIKSKKKCALFDKKVSLIETKCGWFVCKSKYKCISK
tara:strand:+ start:456 stop:704 length:249 start_codon:yes stop_codon:yes gene_type:complete